MLYLFSNFQYIHWLAYPLQSGGFFAGKLASANDAPAPGTRFDSGRVGAQYRQRYLKDGYFKALSLIKEVAVGTVNIEYRGAVLTINVL